MFFVDNVTIGWNKIMRVLVLVAVLADQFSFVGPRKLSPRRPTSHMWQENFVVINVTGCLLTIINLGRFYCFKTFYHQHTVFISFQQMRSSLKNILCRLINA